MVCNSRYREYFEKIDDLVLPGAKFIDIVGAAYDRNIFEQAPSDKPAWLNALMERRAKTFGVREQVLKGGLFLQVSDHRTKDGGIVSIYTDVTELRQREEELRRQSGILEATLENMDQGISMVDEGLNVVIFNQKFLDYLDFPKEDFHRGFHMSQAFRLNAMRGEYGEGDIEEQIAERLELSAKFLPHRFERARPDGRTLEIVGNPVATGGFVSTYTDITKRKEHEAELMAAKNAAEAALDELQQAQDRLVQAEKMASLGQLTAGIAHEIKNPLNFVNNFAKLSSEMLVELADILSGPIAALGGEDREDAQDLLGIVKGNLEKINEHGRRADQIVKNMLLHSREGPSEMRNSDINGIAAEALNLAYHGARAENSEFNVAIESSFDDGIGRIDCYPQDIMRVFLNIITNGMYAAYHHHAGGGRSDGSGAKVEIASKLDGDRAVFTIRDNGSGIPEDIRDQIFLPFFTTKPAGEGTGLGLSLSYDIVVKQHGGTMSVDSKPGEFTIFEVSLPQALGAAGEYPAETS